MTANHTDIPAHSNATEMRVQGSSVTCRFTVLTVNTHKGFTALNRRFILPELREAVRSVSADVVFLQEVTAPTHSTQALHQLAGDAAVRIPRRHAVAAVRLWPQCGVSAGRSRQRAAVEVPDHPPRQPRRVDHGHENRGLLHCVLRLPGDGQEVHAICVHLGLRESAPQRQLELLADVCDDLPADAPLVVAGDFNDWRQRGRCAAQALRAARSLRRAPRQAGADVSPRAGRSAPGPHLRAQPQGQPPQVLTSRPWSHLSDHAPLSVEIEL